MLKITFLVLLLGGACITIHAYRSYKLIFNKIECTAVAPTVSNFKCLINKSGSHPGVDLTVNHLTSSQKLLLDFSVFAVRSKESNFLIFKLEKFDICASLIALNSKLSSANFVRLFMDNLLLSGNIPKQCPTEPYNYKFANFTVDPESLPPYLPESNYKLEFAMFNRSVELYNVRLSCAVVAKKKRGAHKRKRIFF